MASRSRTCLSDACVVSPVADTYLRAAQEALGAAGVRVGQKDEKYSHLCPTSIFVVLCLGSFAAWSDEMGGFMDVVATAWAIGRHRRRGTDRRRRVAGREGSSSRIG